MIWGLIFIIPGIFFLVMFLRERTKHASGKSLIWKTLTSVCFLSLAFYGVWQHAMNGTGNLVFSLLVFAGLFCGLLGDIWLDLKWNCPEENDMYTFAGFWSFASGHVCFLAALIAGCRSAEGIWWIIIPLLLAAALGIAVGSAGRLMKLDYGKFKKITMLYGALLIGSCLVSGSLLIQSKFTDTRLWLFFIGAILFLLSDLILSGTYFGKGKSRPADIISNHIFYYAAQFLIAGSLLAAA